MMVLITLDIVHESSLFRTTRPVVTANSSAASLCSSFECVVLTLMLLGDVEEQAFQAALHANWLDCLCQKGEALRPVCGNYANSDSFAF